MTEKQKFIRSITIASIFLGAIWVIFGLDYLLDFDFKVLGIYPRSISGLIGIFASPFIHSNLSHIYNNSTGLFPMIAALFFFYPKISWRALFFITLTTGLWVWISARPSFHVGASGVIYGLAAFLFFSGIFRKDRRVIAVSLVIAMMYGSMIWGIFPGEKGVSWESHLLGGIAGVLIAWVYRKQDVLPKKKYSWENEPENTPFSEFGIWNHERVAGNPDFDYRQYKDRHYKKDPESPQE